jgi:hypothetical protein
MRKVAAAGDTVVCRINLNTSGPNGNGVYAGLVYDGPGMGLENNLTVPSRS